MMNNKSSLWKNTINHSNRITLVKTPLFEIVQYRMQASNLKKNLRLVFISDSHFGKYPPPAEEIIKSVNELKPDYIIFGGDIVSESSGLTDAFKFMSSLKADSGKFSVLGNWELKRSICKNISYWRNKYAGAGFRLLRDKCFETENCVFTGISPSKSPNREFFHQPLKKNAKFSVLIAHSPDDIVSQNVDFGIAFSGHTHAGQIRIPFFGALRTSSMHWKKFEYGLFERDDGAKLIVSSGLGTCCLPIRFLCPPEIVVAELLN